jgi:RNA polymerase sigma-70 factor (ECF subfamily)
VGSAGKPEPSPAEAVEQAHRAHWGRLLGLLTAQLRSLDLAEECLAEAFAAALASWEGRGVPARPAAWLLSAARNRAIDVLRREANLARKLPQLVVEDADRHSPAADEPADGSDEVSTIPDERLRLLFTCCHPALAPEARVALTLRCVGGLTTVEVARAFLVAEPTMAARITRAKKKIAQAGIPYRVPTGAELPERLPGVLAVLYLIFTEGYAATTGDLPIRRDLSAEAIRLTRVVVGLMPDEPEAAALLGLMLLQHSRRDARFDRDGGLVLLPDQDRSRWHREEIAEGLELVRRATRLGAAAELDRPAGPYLLQAAIAGRHAVAARAADTDWAAIARLYAELEAVTGSPVVRLNRAVAVAEAGGPAAGLALLDGLAEALPRYHLLPAARADLLRRLGRHAEAAAAYDDAIRLAGNTAEREFLRQRRADLDRLGR